MLDPLYQHGTNSKPDVELLAMYRQMHAKGHFQGYTVMAYGSEIRELVKKHEVTSILDYGCGKGHQYLAMRAHHAWGILPHVYDPAVPGLDHLPSGTYGGVISIDVAEHIPEDGINSYLAELFEKAEKFVFLTACTRPAKKKLPDGRNCHITIKPEHWWQAKVDAANQKNIDVVLRFTE